MTLSAAEDATHRELSLTPILAIVESRQLVAKKGIRRPPVFGGWQLALGAAVEVGQLHPRWANWRRCTAPTWRQHLG